MTFVRYIFVQVIAYLFDMGGFVFFMKVMGGNPIASNIFGKILAGAFAFFSHQRVTFRLPGADRDFRQAVKYIALLLLNIPLSSLVLSVILSFLTLEVLAKFTSDVLCVLLTFLLSRYWVFASKTDVLSGSKQGAVSQ